jgi:hypothetical protein
MSEASVLDIKEMIPELATTDSGTLSLYLDDASLIVQGEGIGTTAAEFNLLHRYMTAHLLADAGFVSGDVSSESVGDVSIQYGSKSQSDDGLDKWERLYNAHKARTQGMTGRIL